MPCPHASLTYEPSSHAATVGFRKRTKKQLYVAAGEEASLSRQPNIPRIPYEKLEEQEQRRCLDPPSLPPPPLHYDTTFPAPLVLPGDELAYDPKYPPQSYRSWLNDKDRNRVERHVGGMNVVYVVAPPAVEDEGLGREMAQWASLRMPGKRGKGVGSSGSGSARPKTEDVVEYLAAFYLGVPVRMLPSQGKTALRFARWDDDGDSAPQPKRAKSRSKSTPTSRAVPSAIALKTSKEAIRVRVRERQGDIYRAQLNLNDLLDVAIEILPDDAYALLMLVDHDLYEDDDDDFACGRAYGGSRVAVVSMARYHPDADEVQGVDREHAWPASHCATFVESAIRGESKGPGESLDDPIALSSSPASEGKNQIGQSKPTVLEVAVESYRRAQSQSECPRGTLDKTMLWLGRVCRTASHELGHCFGIDHCVYYACVMQGTASIVEDARQPPYLCPVDLAKVTQATGVDMEDRYSALAFFCADREGGMFFEPFDAWLHGRMREVDRLQIDLIRLSK